MGVFDRFRRRKKQQQPLPLPQPRVLGVRPPTVAVPPQPSSRHALDVLGGGFAVIDVETTGLSAAQHRIVEVAVVRTDAAGRVTGEWSTRVDPEGPVGATHIHGIAAADVVGAPRFRDLIPQLNGWLAGSVVAAHNARFDLAFLRSEYRWAGWNLPWLPTLCTLDASDHYMPLLDRRRLSDCCAAARIPIRGQHSALGDARATAGLLAFYLNPAVGSPVRPSDLDMFTKAAGVSWPAGPTTAATSPVVAVGADRVSRIRVNVTAVSRRAAVPNLVKLLEDFSLADALDEGAPAGSLIYLEKLAEVLEDGELTSDETADLDDVAAIYELSIEDRAQSHRAFLLALCHLALDDGMVTRAERDELRTMAGLLNLPEKLITNTLDQAEAARHARLSAQLRPLPEPWAQGEPLRVGDKVAFTGCDEGQRARLEQRAVELGVRVMNNVSRRTAMLVTDGDFAGTKAAAAAESRCRLVHPDVFDVLMQNLQPALPRHSTHGPAPTPQRLGISRAPTHIAAAANHPAASPAVVRQWARDNGYQVGHRGRLPEEIFEAYERAVKTEQPSMHKAAGTDTPALT